MNPDITYTTVRELEGKSRVFQTYEFTHTPYPLGKSDPATNLAPGCSVFSSYASGSGQ